MGCGMKYTEEKYKDIIASIDSLGSIMAQETDVGHDFTPEVDHDKFIVMCDSGMLQTISAKQDGEIVGFHVTMITNDIFYKTKKTAYVMFYFILKEHRGGGKGLNMFNFAEKLFKEKGIDRSFMSRKIHINNEKMFNSLGYSKTESSYEKYYE